MAYASDLSNCSLSISEASMALDLSDLLNFSPSISDASMALDLSEKSHKNPMAPNGIWSFIPGNDLFGLFLPFKWLY